VVAALLGACDVWGCVGVGGTGTVCACTALLSRSFLERRSARCNAMDEPSICACHGILTKLLRFVASLTHRTPPESACVCVRKLPPTRRHARYVHVCPPAVLMLSLSTSTAIRQTSCVRAFYVHLSKPALYQRCTCTLHVLRFRCLELSLTLSAVTSGQQGGAAQRAGRGRLQPQHHPVQRAAHGRCGERR
jgi:hypothetical protein